MKIIFITTVVHDTDNLIIRDVPVSSTVVELDDHRLAIIDTGMAGNPDLIEELDGFGYSPQDFALVFNTHLHQDHIGGNHLFKKARIIISRRELAYEFSYCRMMQECGDPLTVLRSLGRNTDHTTHQIARDLKQLAEDYPTAGLVGDFGQIEFYEDDPDLPGCFSNLQVPGHSVDSRAIVIKGKTRNCMAAGDALYHRDLWKADPNIGLHYSETLFRQNASRLAGFPGIIIPGHDRAFDNSSGAYIREDNLFI